MSKAGKELGKKGEVLAAQYLKRQGYDIKEQNWRSSLGEIDLIARDKETIVFVEVKTRKSAHYGSGEMAVDKHKQEQIAKVALSYLLKRGLKDVDCRFDVVSVMLSENKNKIELIKDAFPLGERWV
jgi:putative endonuclease